MTNRKLMYTQTKTDARPLFYRVVITRKWHAVHGGVYVEKKDGMISNPYIEEPGIMSRDGRLFSKEKPAP